MKSIFASALILAASTLFNEVSAVEHAQLIDTSDYVNEWYDKKVQGESYEEEKKHKYQRKVDTNIRPVIGILSEPFRGQITPTAESNEFESIGSDSSGFSYVPRTHVQFLEQAGIRVIPIDYNLPEIELKELLEQVNGVYFPGDSHLAVTDEHYKSSFLEVMMFAEAKAYDNGIHFPVFMMGNTLQTYVRSKSRTRGSITEMRDLKHTNSRVNLIEHPSDTFLFNGMSREDKQAVFNTAQMFNMQVSGVTVSNLENENAVRSKLKPIAVFSSHDIENENDQFIAIAEGKDMPIYAFTYGIDLIQFYFEDPSASLDNFWLDHSIIARKHAQSVALLIA